MHWTRLGRRGWAVRARRGRWGGGRDAGRALEDGRGGRWVRGCTWRRKRTGKGLMGAHESGPRGRPTRYRPTDGQMPKADGRWVMADGRGQGWAGRGGVSRAQQADVDWQQVARGRPAPSHMPHATCHKQRAAPRSLHRRPRRRSSAMLAGWWAAEVRVRVRRVRGLGRVG